MTVKVSWTRFSILGFLLAVLSSGVTGCLNSKQTLTKPQMEKLAPSLQRLVQNEARSMDRFTTAEREDGTLVYSVILRSTDPAALRAANLPINSVQGPIVTARLSVAQIRTAATLKPVEKIETPTQTQPTF